MRYEREDASDPMRVLALCLAWARLCASLHLQLLAGPAEVEVRTALSRRLAQLDARCFPGGLWSEKQYAGVLEDERCEVLSVSIDGAMAGVCCTSSVLDEASITTLFVDPEARRQQIGRTLMLAALWSAYCTRKAFLTLEVRSQNDAAVQLYRGLGFGQVGLRPRYYRNPEDDAVLYTYTFTEVCTPGVPGVGHTAGDLERSLRRPSLHTRPHLSLHGITGERSTARRDGCSKSACSSHHRLCGGLLNTLEGRGCAVSPLSSLQRVRRAHDSRESTSTPGPSSNGRARRGEWETEGCVRRGE